MTRKKRNAQTHTSGSDFRDDQCYQYYTALKIHTPGQVHTFNEWFKLSHTVKVFYCSWQVVRRL